MRAKKGLVIARATSLCVTVFTFELKTHKRHEGAVPLVNDVNKRVGRCKHCLQDIKSVRGNRLDLNKARLRDYDHSLLIRLKSFTLVWFREKVLRSESKRGFITRTC